MAALPSDAEVRAVGEALGLGPGPYPTQMRARIMTAIEQTRMESRREAASGAADKAFARRVRELADALLDAGVTADARSAILGGLAPTLYRPAEYHHLPVSFRNQEAPRS